MDGSTLRQRGRREVATSSPGPLPDPAVASAPSPSPAPAVASAPGPSSDPAAASSPAPSPDPAVPGPSQEPLPPAAGRGWMNQSLKDILADPQRRAAVLQVLPILVGALALYAAYFMFGTIFGRNIEDLQLRATLVAPIRIHVYDVPEELMGVPAAACPEDMYYTEILLPAMVKRTRKYRSPAATANLFWIPHRSTCQYHACLTRRGFAGTGAAEDTDGGGAGIPAACKAEVAATFDAIWRHVATTARHWNASAGSDHIVVFAWDAASELLGPHPVREHIRPAIHLTHYGTVAPADAFAPHKDIVIPPYLNANLWGDAHRRGRGLRTRTAAGGSAVVPSLALFAGTIHNDTAYSGGVRHQLAALAAEPGSRLRVHRGPIPNYPQELSVATFALCPGGWVSWTPRPFEAFTVGSIPVLFDANLRLPFERQINYRSATVKIAPGAVDGTERILANMSASAIEAKRQAIQRIWFRFFYTSVTVQSREDAFLLLIRELSQRVGLYIPIGNDHY